MAYKSLENHLLAISDFDYAYPLLISSSTDNQFMLFLHRGISHRHMGNFKLAETDLQRAREIQPESLEVKQAGEDLAKAREEKVNQLNAAVAKPYQGYQNDPANSGKQHAVLMAHSLTIAEPGGDGYLEEGETATLKFTLANTGNATAKNVQIRISDTESLKGLRYEKQQSVKEIKAGAQVVVSIQFKGEAGLPNGSTDLNIEISDAEGNKAESFRRVLNVKGKGKPALVTWKNFDAALTVQQPRILLEACIQSETPLSDIRVYLNGEKTNLHPVPVRNSQSDCQFIVRQEVQLAKGLNRLEIGVVNDAGEVRSEVRNATLNMENRVALVVGNSSYRSISRLRNPANDARAMAIELRRSDFEVIELIDADYKTMRAAVRDFYNKLSKNKPGEGVGLFYFAGHGLQYQGENYLVPVDANIHQPFDIPAETQSVNQVMDAMVTADTRMNIMILDACRNNPFPSATRSSSAGLASIQQAKGCYIAFATAPGSVALDSFDQNSQNGLYTQELLKAMKVPGLTIEQVFKKVRENVRQLSGNQQITWDNASITGEFFFKY